MKKLFFTALFLLPLLTIGQEIVPVNTTKKTEAKTFKMYPNPAYGEELYITTTTNGEKKIKIFDVFGETVLATNLRTNTLNISRLQPGVYALQLTENKKNITRKLVVR